MVLIFLPTYDPWHLFDWEWWYKDEEDAFLQIYVKNPKVTSLLFFVLNHKFIFSEH